MAPSPGETTGTARTRTAAVRVMFVVTEDWYFVSHRLALARELQAAGCEVLVATRCGPAAAAIVAAGVQVVPVPFERSLRYPWRDLRALVVLARALRNEQPDLVHLVALKPILLGGMLLRAGFGNIRAVWAFTGMGYLFTSGSRLARFLRPLVCRVLRTLNVRERDRMVIQNGADHTLLLTLGIAAPQQLAIVAGAGLDLADFPARPYPRTGPALVVLPARLLRDKGIYEFVAAAARVREHYPGTRFVLAGRFDRDNHGAIEAADLERWLAAGLVEWWGHREDIGEVFAQAAVVCLPSWREGLSKALLEAAATARPLVATDVPGCREICLHNETGVLVPRADAAALAGAIVRILGDLDWAEQLGCAARKHVEAHYSVTQIGAETLAVYHELLAQQGVGR